MSTTTLEPYNKCSYCGNFHNYNWQMCKDLHNQPHDWHCGCGHWNGANLAVCAMCGRTPNESLIQKEK
jgi:hypothetical protein